MDPSLHILVADDMEGMRRILTNSLHQMGVKSVLTASHGAEAWRLVQNHRFNLVITDWNMPHMNGLELLKAIRSHPERGDLPVLMMTAEAERHQVQLAVQAGVSGYMLKPFTTGALEAKIRKIMAQPSARMSETKVPPVLTPQREQGPISKPSATQDAPAAQATLLAVDDIPDNLDVLVAALGEHYTIKVAGSGERALKILAAGKMPDLILLDVMMPEMDGYEVCRRIKADPATRDIPVIFLTAMHETVDVTRGFAAGAVDFVTKPVDQAILQARIETHLRLRRMVAELQRSRVALIEQNAVLEENVRLRDEFERIAQHDLKNPVAGIVSFAASLLDDASLAEQHKDVLRYVEQSGRRTLNMINMSLDLYKMERGTYQYEPSSVDVVQILRSIVGEMASELASRSISVAYTVAGQAVSQPEPIQVLADETLCFSMFSNLLRNSLEAAREGTRIAIDFHRGESEVRTTITNDGTVPHDVRERFFDKFATSGKPHGNGLGTFSARLIARTQGGDIAMQTSDEASTTTITVKLPYGLQAELPHPASPPEA
ncbi:response regulator [Curvibacter sp. APW13]|uniref:response regulator n=1 Tax=Curvibacter sp. APW13 TaxID=3077236 RepID=UPI0028DE9038|nr:response regulator [Curvibacter sp. APW13]MDT8991395.1 response regulator [Curvibacter sp. APW13]